MKTLLLETSCLSDGTQWSLCHPGGGDVIADIADHLPPEGAEAVANRIQDTLAACHGLDLPPDVPPGALAALVDAARDVDYGSRIAGKEAALRHGRGVLKIREILAAMMGDGAPVSPPVPREIEERLDYLRGEIEAERISYGEIAELQDLAPYIDKGDTVLLEWAGVPEFPEDEEPERKPYGYAVKTPGGYVATQGRETWFESEPVGWAVYSSEAHARSMVPRDRGEVVPVYR